MDSSHDKHSDSNGLNYPILYEDLAAALVTENASNRPRAKVVRAVQRSTFQNSGPRAFAQEQSAARLRGRVQSTLAVNSSHRKAPALPSHRSPRRLHATYEFPRAEARADIPARAARAARNPQLCIR